MYIIHIILTQEKEFLMNIIEYSIYKHQDTLIGTLTSDEDGFLIIDSNGDFKSKQYEIDSVYLSELSLVSSHNSVLTMMTEFQTITEASLI